MSEPTELSESSSYADLAKAIMSLKEEIARRKKKTSELQAELERLTQDVIPRKMEADEFSTVNVKNIGRLTVTQQMKVSTKAGAQPFLQKWLRDNGYEELISEVVNPSTLKAFIKERIEEMDEYPEEYLNIYAYEQASLTKK